MNTLGTPHWNLATGARRLVQRKRFIALIFIAYKALRPFAATELLQWGLPESTFTPSVVVYIQDSTDGACFGPDGFGPCDADDLWAAQPAPVRRWRRTRNGHLLELVDVSGVVDGLFTPAAGDANGRQCLQRKRCRAESSPLNVGRCGHCGAKDWALDTEGRLSQAKGKFCMVRDGDEARMQECAAGWTPLVLRRAQFAQQDNAAGGAQHSYYSQSAAALSGPTWTEPESQQTFPRQLEGPGTSSPALTLVTGGGYTKAMVLRVYGMAFYVDVPGLLAAPELAAFRGAGGGGATADGGSKELLLALSRSTSFDKSVSLRLAMHIGKETAVRAMNADFDMSDEHKALLIETALKSGDASCCGTGTELRFTTRKSGLLDVYLDGRLVSSLRNEGLSEALWRQYIGENPVSVATREKLATAVAAVLRGGQHGHLLAPHLGGAASATPPGAAAKRDKGQKRRRRRSALDGQLDRASSARMRLVTMKEKGWFWSWNGSGEGGEQASASLGSLLALALAAFVAFVPASRRETMQLNRGENGVGRRLTQAAAGL